MFVTNLLKAMKYYINCLKQSDALEYDIKELIPDMNMRRRMSRVMKMGTTTALEAMLEFDVYGQVDAIVTATGLGCIADSEKFLLNLLTSNEQMLNPTPFIQSTFNTIGAQIALIKSLHCYNNTFTHRYSSFESALLDATLCLSGGRAKAVLVGVFDESTPTVEIVLQRLNVLKHKRLGEGALFFVLTAECLECSVAEIELSLDTTVEDGVIMVSTANDTIWCGAVAQVITTMINEHRDGVVVNDMGGEFHSTVKIRCI